LWDKVVELAETNVSKRPNNKTLSDLWAQTYELDQNVLSILLKAQKKAPIGIVTNIDRQRSEYLLSHNSILRDIEMYFPSYIYRAVKPRDKFWKMITEKVHSRYGCNTRIVYIDDRIKHINASAAHEWHGILFEDLESLENNLVRLGLI